MTERRRIAWFLVMIIAVAGPASAARLGRLIGKVVDTEGKPIAGVTVTTTSPDIAGFTQVATTDSKGLFKVDFEQVNVTYRYEFEKVGYVTLRVEQQWTLEGTERDTYQMTAAPTTTAEGKPLASTSNPAILAFNAGVEAFRGKDYPTAKAKFEEALDHDSNLRLAWAGLIQVHAKQRQNQQAVETAEKAIALGITDETILLPRWEAYRDLGDKAKAEAARADLEKFGRLTEEAKRIHNEAVALTKAGDDAGAFAKFQEAVAADPNFQQALLGIGTAGLKIDRAAEALAAAETVLKADPQNEPAIRIRYNAALKLGDEAKVVDALVSLAVIDPTMARDSLYKMATAAFDAARPEEAKKRFLEVLKLDPNHARSHYLLGLILMGETSKEAKQEARSHFERFLELTPNDPEAATAKEAVRFLKQP